MPAFIPSQSDWEWYKRQLAKLQADTAMLKKQIAAVANQVDLYGNTTTIVGALNQTVLIGATASEKGVHVGTGIGSATAPEVGIAWRKNLVTTTITTTGGNTSATVASATGLTTGMVIGAMASDGSDAIVPGTTILTISGTTITLSIKASATVSGAYCAACNWYQLSDLTVP